jgi:hypothetical protein
MRGLVFGLALVPFVALVGVSSVGAQSSPEADGSQKVQPAPGQARAPKKSNKQISKTPSSSLTSAEAYAVEHSDKLPASSSTNLPSPPVSPATHSWTGFHVGAGVGAGSQ